MKKQFFRVKQFADQTFSRAGKTDALPADLVVADKRIEFITKTCTNVNKKLSAALLGQGQDNAAKEKRLKKSSEYALAVALESGDEDDDDLLKQILVVCHHIQMCLAKTVCHFDVQIESNVVLPLQQIIDVDIPNIIKQKRYLNRLILDMDSAKSRYQTAMKHIASSNSGSGSSKIDACKDEWEDLEMRVEQCRDVLASDMFHTISKESEIATLLLEYMKLQQSSYRMALDILNELVPELESTINNSEMKPVFGCALEEHLRITNRRIAFPLEVCICMLLECGMEEEGLFRVAGGASKVRRLKLAFDANCITLETALDYTDMHVIASVLKSYLRELPEPLLTYNLYDEWIAALKSNTEDAAKMNMLWNILHKLPRSHYDNLRYLVKFLDALTKNQEVNKMSPQNLAIVIAPNLIWSRESSSSNIGINMNVAGLHTALVECLINCADWFFPEEEIFYLTLEEPSKRPKGHKRSNSVDTKFLSPESIILDEGAGMKRCQSTTSLEEPTLINNLEGSPKPVIRTRKNKPAPVPPVNNNQGKQSSGSPTSPSGSVNMSPKISPGDVNSKISLKDNFFANPPREDEAEESMFESKGAEDSKQFIAAESGNSGNTSTIATALEHKKPPVPAPRTSLELQAGVLEAAMAPVVAKKPMIPDRPPSLKRPSLSSSFRNVNIGDGVGERLETVRSKGPSLERAHMYSVDKKQVSIIDIDNTSIESTDLRQFRPSSASISSAKKEAFMQNKDVSKDENIANVHVSSHARTLSEGRDIKGITMGTTTVNRSVRRHIPPPPQPPPPPPVTGKPRIGSNSDSTNL